MCVYLTITTFSFRYKFIYFYLFLSLVTMWGFFYSLEGIIILLLLGELLIVLLFILFYLTIQVYSIPTINNNKVLATTLLTVIFIVFYPTYQKNVNLISYSPVYFNTGKIVSDDFFIFFFFLFFDFKILVYFLGLVLTLFSIFFILFYSSYRFFLLEKNTTKRSIFILRKQNMLHQSTYKPSYKTFQK